MPPKLEQYVAELVRSGGYSGTEEVFEEALREHYARRPQIRWLANEPKQIHPGEDIRVTDGRTEVSGQTAVMAINEKLLQTLMEKNPDLSFAIQESFPFRGTYADALPLGPLMELGARDAILKSA